MKIMLINNEMWLFPLKKKRLNAIPLAVANHNQEVANRRPLKDKARLNLAHLDLLYRLYLLSFHASLTVPTEI